MLFWGFIYCLYVMESEIQLPIQMTDLLSVKANTGFCQFKRFVQCSTHVCFEVFLITAIHVIECLKYINYALTFLSTIWNDIQRL